jgi:hypothetical protein
MEWHSRNKDSYDSIRFQKRRVRKMVIECRAVSEVGSQSQTRSRGTLGSINRILDSKRKKGHTSFSLIGLYQKVF